MVKLSLENMHKLIYCIEVVGSDEDYKLQVSDFKNMIELPSFNEIYKKEPTVKNEIDGTIVLFNEMLQSGELNVNLGRVNDIESMLSNENYEINDREFSEFLKTKETSERSTITEGNDKQKPILDLNPGLTDDSIINIPKKKTKPIIDNNLKTLNNSISNEKIKKHISSPAIRTSDINETITTKKTYGFNDLNEDEKKLASHINLPNDKIYIFKALRMKFGKAITDEKLRAYGVNQFSRDVMRANPNKHRDTTIKSVIRSVLVYDHAFNQ